jgi:DNA polymerase-3 subunit gamma/tau
MSEIALYRKYRPEHFKDVLGQEHIVAVLKGALKAGNVSHAYLFAGPRGTGKTSIARILAREAGASANDIYEIDAASNRGIDEIRELREGVRVLPFDSPVKVYIIDEVHMLTTPAFNALLKTLEEPPAHAIFILATTELHKLPDTIISRCQQFTFHKPSESVLEKVALDIAKLEGFAMEKEAASLVALLGDGSFRDTQGILQKVLSFEEGEKITGADVERVTGAPGVALVRGFIEALIGKRADDALGIIRTASEQSIDMKVFLKLVLRALRFVMLLRYAPEMKKSIGEKTGESELKFLEKAAEQSKNISLSPILKELLSAYEETDRAYIKELPLELAVVALAGQAIAGGQQEVDTSRP